jgi:ribosomal protein L37E
MPDVAQEKRHKLYKIVSEMWAANIKADGDLNYLLFAFCKRCIKPSYGNIKNYCAELEECAIEIRRKILGPYEDEREKEHGTIQ